MSKIYFGSAILTVALVLSPSSSAQAPDDPAQRAAAGFEAWTDVIVDFIKDVEFDEGDVTRMLELWPDFEKLETDVLDTDDENPERFREDLQRVLNDTVYRRWIASHGLDGEGWLRKTMRIQTMLMREQMGQSHQQYRLQQQEQMAMVEEQCTQVDEATCQQMKQAMKMGLAISEAMGKAWEKLPRPTAPEAALLDEYSDRLNALMESDYEDEHEYEDYEDYEDHEDEEND